MRDANIQRDDELSDSEDEGEGGRKNHHSHKYADSVQRSPRSSVGPTAATSASGGGPSPRLARVGIMASMRMDIDPEDEKIAPSTATVANTSGAAVSPDVDATAGRGTVAPADTASAYVPMDDSGDFSAKNYPEIADGAVPDVNMDGPSSAVREQRGK